jgi:SAM-dependent methyltransferase
LDDKFEPNPPEYIEALEKYLYEKARGTSYEEPIRRSYMDYERFFSWIGHMEQYLDIKGKRVLDSGCSVGGLMVALALKGAVPCGVDVSEDLYRMAEIRLKKLEGASVVLLESDTLPFEDDYFDAAFSIHVVEHVSGLDKYIDELLRVLKRGGIALIEFPSRYFPLEPHNHLYLLPYLPKRVSNALCRALAGTGLFSDDLTLRLRNAADDDQLASFLSRSAIKSRLGQRVDILEESYPRDRLIAEAAQSSRLYQRFVSALPWRIIKRFSWIFQRNITLIVRKK